MSFNPEKHFSSGASSVTVSYSIDNGCQGNVSFEKGGNDSFIRLDNVASGVKISIDANTGTSRTGHVYMKFNGRRCEDKTINIYQSGATPDPVGCILDSVTFRPDSGQMIQVDGCNTSQTIALRGTSVSSYTNCESTRETTTKSVTVSYPKNESSSPSNYQVTVSGVSVTLSRTACGSPEPEDTYERQYLTIESLYNNNVIYFKSRYANTIKTISVSTDNGTTWSEYTSSTGESGTTIATLDRGGKALIKGDNSSYEGVRFLSSWEYELYGNIMSLLYADSFADRDTLPGNKTFSGLFSQSAKLKKAENLVLPSTALTERCYYYMFDGCISLTVAPELPATTLASYCYEGMFEGCINLTTAPVLPATTLTGGCYYAMFRGCTRLTTVSNLPATILVRYCYSRMFADCTSLTVAPGLPATTLASNCYENMFQGCTSLTTAPVLPATTLADSCYREMFWACSNLTTAPELSATGLTESCYLRMFADCTSLTVAPGLPATTLASNCYENMFQGCTSLTTAPQLPATTLTNHCYEGMFEDCTSLVTAPSLPAMTLATHCYQSMLAGCTRLTTAPELPATSLMYHCYAIMFENCTSLRTAPRLPAKTLEEYCYGEMFKGCTNLNSITCLATDISAHVCTDSWVDGVAASGTFTKAAGMTDWERGSSAIPNGWGVIDAQ